MMSLHAIKVEAFRLLRFGLVGTSVALLYYVSSVAVVATALGTPLVATTIASVVSVFASYFGHMHFSFAVEPNHRKFVWRFGIAAAASYGLNLVLTWLLMHRLHIPYPIGFAIITAALPAWTYIVGRWWVFAPDRGWDEGTPAEVRRDAEGS
jgi:putative flippase GtrA